jgi:hypothetical protein
VIPHLKGIKELQNQVWNCGYKKWKNTHSRYVPTYMDKKV